MLYLVTSMQRPYFKSPRIRVEKADNIGVNVDVMDTNTYVVYKN